MQNQFLLLVALTPQEYINPLRSKLQEVSLASLQRVKYDNFQVLVLGDREGKQGKLTYVKAPNGTKGLRLEFALKYIQDSQIDFDYIARFDDDDVLNPSIFELISEVKADCIADEYHAFYDLNSHLTIAAKKNWLANTVFLKKEHALTKLIDGRTLVEQDHAEEWHTYFKDKEVSYASPDNPIYLRVLSPTSITSTSTELGSYARYLDSFGDWLKPWRLYPFNISLEALKRVHEEFYPNGSYVPVKNSIVRRLIRRIKRLLNIGS